jgi:hypothetical protein
VAPARNKRSNMPKTFEKFLRVWVERNHKSPLHLKALTSRARALGYHLPQASEITKLLVKTLEDACLCRSLLFYTVHKVRTVGVCRYAQIPQIGRILCSRLWSIQQGISDTYPVLCLRIRL